MHADSLHSHVMLPHRHLNKHCSIQYPHSQAAPHAPRLPLHITFCQVSPGSLPPLQQPCILKVATIPISEPLDYSNQRYDRQAKSHSTVAMASSRSRYFTTQSIRGCSSWSGWVPSSTSTCGGGICWAKLDLRQSV